MCGPLNRGMFVAVILLVAAGVIGLQTRPTRAADDPPADKPATTRATLGKPPMAKSDPFAVPNGKPQALMSFIAKMRRMKPPKNASEEDKTAFATKSQAAIVEAADKILESKPVGSARVAALKAEIGALLALKELGDSGANKKLGDLADGLKDDKQIEVARLVKPYVGIAQADAATGKDPVAPRPWAEIKPKFAAFPENRDLAKEAIVSVQSLERMGTTDAAVAAYRELGAILAKSKDPQIAAQAGMFDGIVRRLTLPGKPIEISGHLVDGTPANPAALKGKVVLVDFWATWCGPCRAELPNVLANYEKYHGRGFEVVGVSCDQDKDALVKFIAEQKLPWPIMFQQPGERSMADYYGITGIPTAILTNKKGEVISLNARGPELTRLLEELLGK
jgi:thiol-disulfide isomerase/thioredoxin